MSPTTRSQAHAAVVSDNDASATQPIQPTKLGGSADSDQQLGMSPSLLSLAPFVLLKFSSYSFYFFSSCLVSTHPWCALPMLIRLDRV